MKENEESEWQSVIVVDDAVVVVDDVVLEICSKQMGGEKRILTPQISRKTLYSLAHILFHYCLLDYGKNGTGKRTRVNCGARN